YPWIIELRNAIEEARRTGPRIFAAGPIVTAPGGHPAGTLLAGNPVAIAAATRQIATPDEGRAVVRELASGGVDVIKVGAASAGRRNRPERIPTIGSATLVGVVSEASRAGLPATVHWGNVDELETVVSAKPTQIEHAGYAPISQPLISKIGSAGII